MTTESIYQKPVVVMFNIDCDEVLCSSPVHLGIDDVSVGEGWDWEEE